MNKQLVFADPFINPWGKMINNHVSSPTTWNKYVHSGGKERLDYHKLEIPVRLHDELTELSFHAKAVRIDLDVVIGELNFVGNELIDGIYNVWEDGSLIGFTGDNGLVQGYAPPFFVLEVRNGNLFVINNFDNDTAAMGLALGGFDPNTPPDNFGFGAGFQCSSYYPFDKDGKFFQYQVNTGKNLLQEAFFIDKERRTTTGSSNCTVDNYYLKFAISESSKGTILQIRLYRFGEFIDYSDNREIEIGVGVGMDEDSYSTGTGTFDTLGGITQGNSVNYTASIDLLEHLNKIRQTLDDKDGDGVVKLPVYVHEFTFPFDQEFRGGVQISNIKVKPVLTFQPWDWTGNGCVDKWDLRELLFVIRSGDERFNIIDARKLVTHFKNDRGATCTPK
jgi:hypothetical protein